MKSAGPPDERRYGERLSGKYVGERKNKKAPAVAGAFCSKIVRADLCHHIKLVEVHHFRPGGNEVTHELFLGVVLRIHFA